MMMRGSHFRTCLTVALTFVALTNATVVKKSPKFDFPPHLIGLNVSDKDELKPLKAKYNPVDLSVDNYDDEVPNNLKEALVNATLSGDVSLNQMSDSKGLARLREALAALYSKILNRKLDPDQNVLVTEGATEAYHAVIHGHTSPGDEWIVIEPAYFMYAPIVKIAHGVTRVTTLKLAKHNGTINGDDWVLDKIDMEKLINIRTKGIILNNPLNPIGKVFRLDELEFIAKVAIKYNTLVISDEAHEFVTQKPHIRIASLPGMFGRTITIGTASKSFSVGGWRIGWAYGPAEILNHAKVFHETSVNNNPTPQQDAIAYAIEQELINWGKPQSYFVAVVNEMRVKRDLMFNAFQQAGMAPIVLDGGFCIMVDWTPLKSVSQVDGEKADVEFAKWLIKDVGIFGWPVSLFYSPENKHLGHDYMRYCIHKKDDTLKKAVEKLEKLKSRQRSN